MAEARVSQTYALDAIMHYQAWDGLTNWANPRPEVARHFEPEPVIVPPVLSKSAVVAQPILRLVWTLAFDVLSGAEGVTFVGYSFPPTDTAARVLFAEALRDLPAANIAVVGLERTDQSQQELKARYRDVLGSVPDESFFFDGALPWARTLATDQS